MRTMMRMALGIAASFGLLAIGGAEAQDQPVAATSAVPGEALSVLTYNVEGLPFPLRHGRAVAAGEIADRLKSLRAAGTQPHVVVLQEAFGKAQRDIGRTAGYRYVAYGPDRDLANDEPMSDADRAFAHQARFLKGETVGKWQSSGLAVLSDYPIIDVKRVAFPAYACAGFDCLANKGVMLVTLKVPGSATPVAVVATHMNSKQASGVSPARFGYAFDRQVQTMGLFLRANLAADMPYVFAGDTNIGKSVARRARFEDMLASLPRAGKAAQVRTALGTCLADKSDCTVDVMADARFSYNRGKDLQVYADGAAIGLVPHAIAVPFGRDGAGKMLSDHVGYTASYSLASIAAAVASPSATLLR